MNRLTEWDEFGNADIIALSDMMPEIYAELSFSETNALTEALNRLAKYEDTELEPGEIDSMFIYSVIEENRRLQELAQAEKDGRLVVLPCKVGDLLYEIDLQEYGVITCKALEVHAYIGPDMHVQGAPIVSAVNVSVEVIDGHGEGSGYTFEELDFGKTVFLTREEAETALNRYTDRGGNAGAGWREGETALCG